MRALLITICVLALTRSAAAVPNFDAPPRATTMPDRTMRVVSFNIRNADAEDGPNAWPLRRDVFVKMLLKLDADVYGFQEVLARQQDDLTAALPGYTGVFVGRDDGKRRGEGSPVFFRKNAFDLVASGTFWLSQTPETPGVKGWDAACPRLCTWVVLKGKADGRECFVANTHFDHVGQVARVESARQIVARAADLGGGRPAVLMGDLNSTDETPAYRTFVTGEGNRPGPYADTFRVVHPKPSPDEATFHGFLGGTRAHRIDYVFVSPEWKTLAAGIDRDRDAHGRWPSDHYPVWADLERQ